MKIENAGKRILEHYSNSGKTIIRKVYIQATINNISVGWQVHDEGKNIVLPPEKVNKGLRKKIFRDVLDENLTKEEMKALIDSYIKKEEEKMDSNDLKCKRELFLKKHTLGKSNMIFKKIINNLHHLKDYTILSHIELMLYAISFFSKKLEGEWDENCNFKVENQIFFDKNGTEALIIDKQHSYKPLFLIKTRGIKLNEKMKKYFFDIGIEDFFDVEITEL